MRKPIFDAVAAARGKPWDASSIAILDETLDRLGVPRDGETFTFDTARFFECVRAKFGALSQDQVDGFNAVLKAMTGSPIAFTAYAMATAWWETAKTMQPVREAYWVKNAEAWRKANLRYYPWYGRGYVQLTWEANYVRADKELGLAGELTANPDKALEPDIAAAILRKGMDGGWFTGKSFSTYLPARGLADTLQFREARRIINGVDKRDEIAALAISFQEALS